MAYEIKCCIAGGACTYISIDIKSHFVEKGIGGEATRILNLAQKKITCIVARWAQKFLIMATDMLVIAMCSLQIALNCYICEISSHEGVASAHFERRYSAI